MPIAPSISSSFLSSPENRRRIAIALVSSGAILALYKLLGRARAPSADPETAEGWLQQLLRQIESAWKGRQASSPGGSRSLAASSPKSEARRVGVNLRFLAQLKQLLPILIPGWRSREVFLLFCLTGILVARTWLDIWFSAFNGTVVRAVVSRNRALFFSKAIVLFGLMMWPMSAVNNSLKLTINALSLSFRSRLATHAHDKYLEDMVYYKLSNLDNRIQNPDQLLTQDIEKFAENLSHLYSDIAKPLVDICLFTYKLGQALYPIYLSPVTNSNVEGETVCCPILPLTAAPVSMIVYFVLSGAFLRAISPPFGKFTAQEQNLEGEFRFAHSRIIAHSEEIAFYSGQDREKELINGVYKKILKHVKKVFKLRFVNGIVDSVLVKYLATMLAYVLLSRPAFGPAGPASSSEIEPTKLMEAYSRNSSYMVNLSQAIGRLLLAGRDLTRFAGFTSRVSEFFCTLSSIRQGRYERSLVGEGSSVVEKRGTIIEDDGVIDFDRVPIATPNGDVLVPSLTFRIEKGMNCIVTGPNGCGKSSLFRILGNLWPLYGGTLRKPAPSKLFYVPQKPYLPLGTLRDQVIYPDTSQVARIGKGYDDERLLSLLKAVHLEYLVERGEGAEKIGWNSVQDWADVLSGGEKQRIAMARLFYHKPQFAILDECTSAVSVDVEGLMYDHAKKIGITLLTVSHRPSLFKFHEYVLKFDGQGGYQFNELDLNDDPFASMRSSRSNLQQHASVVERSLF